MLKADGRLTPHQRLEMLAHRFLRTHEYTAGKALTPFLDAIMRDIELIRALVGDQQIRELARNELAKIAISHRVAALGRPTDVETHFPVAPEDNFGTGLKEAEAAAIRQTSDGPQPIVANRRHEGPTPEERKARIDTLDRIYRRAETFRVRNRLLINMTMGQVRVAITDNARESKLLQMILDYAPNASAIVAVKDVVQFSVLENFIEEAFDRD
jgi:hypothetical protein